VLGLAHRTCQPGEVGAAISIAGDNLTVEHGHFGRQLLQQLRDRWETIGEIVPIRAVDDHARADLVGLHAVAVEFHLMQPPIVGGHFFGAN